jgi:DNA repair protein RAD5
MKSQEISTQSARDGQSLHPLWDQSVFALLSVEFSNIDLIFRYAFPVEPVQGMIDLTADERPFYFNSYSGELSLEFPKADTNCTGGILADGRSHPMVVGCIVC